MDKSNRIIISISSDIGYHLAIDWLNQGFNVSGTYRTKNKNCDELIRMGATLFQCDLSDKLSIDKALNFLKRQNRWDVLIIAAGTQNPIGEFLKCNFDDWSDSIGINFTNQLRFFHGLYENRNQDLEFFPTFFLFAGGGTNNATLNYSAYTISKIASIKMIELLDAEIKDVSFSILGPGWVKTKIHNATVDAKDMAGENYLKTINMLAKDEDQWYPMEKVIKCCNWIIDSPRELVSGRNFSAVHDPWESKNIELIKKNHNNFKLRRFGNDLFSILNK